MYIYTYTYIFFKKNYIKIHIYIFGTGQDRDDLVPCPVPKLFGTEISRPEMPWDRMGRAGREIVEHPYGRPHISPYRPPISEHV